MTIEELKQMKYDEVLELNTSHFENSDLEKLKSYARGIANINVESVNSATTIEAVLSIIICQLAKNICAQTVQEEIVEAEKKKKQVYSGLSL